MPDPTLPAPLRRHATPVIPALLQLLAEDGIPAQAALAGTGLDAHTLDGAAGRPSIDQLLQVCRNALRYSHPGDAGDTSEFGETPDEAADPESPPGFAGKVYRTLCRMDDPGAGMKAVAVELHMTDRTLRRRLADEGTTFTAIVHRMRYRIATRHLQRSEASIEQIAAIAGFSDPSNFRRAFIRWTHMSPAAFRRMQQPPGR